MIALAGKKIVEGVGEGKYFVYRTGIVPVAKTKTNDIEREMERLDTASAVVAAVTITVPTPLRLRGRTQLKYPEMAEDVAFRANVISTIQKEKCSAEWAIYTAAMTMADSSVDKERIAEIYDVANQMNHVLNRPVISSTSTKLIIAADSLRQDEVEKINMQSIQGIVAACQEKDSVLINIAKQHGIPCVAVEQRSALAASLLGRRAAIDAHTGTVFISPDRVTVDKLKFQASKTAKAT